MTDYAESVLYPLAEQLGYCAPSARTLLRGPRPSIPGLQFRPLYPGDFLSLKDLHQRLFPIDYDDQFFHRAVNGLEQIFSWVAVAPMQMLPSLKRFTPVPVMNWALNGKSGYSGSFGGAGGDDIGHGGSMARQQQQLPPASQVSVAGEQLLGFITAKPFALSQIEAQDRQLLGFASPALDNDQVLYILTLGVEEGFRHSGIASQLVQAVVQYGAAAGCQAVYLHVISYNTSAQAFYTRLGFRNVALLPNFYIIRSGRQLDPQRQVYDAVLFAYSLPQRIVQWGLPPSPCSPPSYSTTPSLGPAPTVAAFETERHDRPLGAAASCPLVLAPSSGGTVLRAVSQLAAWVPLPASCSPQRRRQDAAKDEGRSGGGSEDGWAEAEVGGGRSWQGGRGGGLGIGHKGGGAVLHRRAVSGGGDADGGSGGGGLVVVQQGPHRPPPDWLKNMFARR